MKNCEFCRVIEKEDSSESKYLAGSIIKLLSSIAVLDKNQFYKGKFVVIFKRHVEDFADLTEDERKKFTDDMIKIAHAIKKILNPDRMNYATLGNIIPHLHWHVIPRYKNDTNWGKPPWPHGEYYLSDKEVKKLINSIKKVLD
jgi:diadenosine tetraphosphate (Ap4A) HIT family hydrolase